MEIGVPSRFACLNIEDEDSSSVQNSKPKDPKKKVKKLVIAELPNITITKKADKTVPAKKIEPKQDATKHTVTIISKKGKKKQALQWEEWKQKDDELENGLYEEDLRNAILLSKLDFEHNKDVYSKLADAENSKQENKKKTKKNKTISLDSFLNHDGGDKRTTNHDSCSASKSNCVMDVKQSGGDFFNSIDSDTKVELKKEIVNAKRKKREANINEIISLAQYQEKYEIEHQLRLTAEEELEKVKAELAAAEVKIKTFYKIVSQGQMRDKAGILLENQQLTAVKNDLTDSVANLHALLEKERSKVASLTTALNNSSKQKEKKRKGH